MNGFSRMRVWIHWRRSHRHPSATDRFETFQTYAGSLHPGTRDLSYSDIQCQRCLELGERVRMPRR